MNKFLVLCGLLVFCAGSGYCERTQLDSLLEQAVACSTPSLANIGPCRMIGIDLAILGRDNPEKLTAGLNTIDCGKKVMTLTAFQYLGDPDTLNIKYFATFASRNRGAREDLLLLFIHVLSGIYSDKSMAALKNASSDFKTARLKAETYVGMAAQGSMLESFPLGRDASTDTFVRASMIRARALMGEDSLVKIWLKSAREEGIPGLEGIEQDLAFGLFLSKKYPEQPEAPKNLEDEMRLIANGQYDNPTRGSPKAIEKFKLEYAYELAVKTQNSEEWDWAFGFLSSHPLNPKYGKRLRDLAAKAVSEEHRRQAGELIAFFDKRTKELEEQEAAARAERKKRTPEMVMEIRVNDLMEKLVSCTKRWVGYDCMFVKDELSMLGKPALPYIIKKGIHHPMEGVQQHTVEVVGQIPDPANVEMLAGIVLKSTNTWVRVAAVNALSGIHSEKSFAIIRDSLRDENDWVKLHAAIALAAYGDISGRDVAINLSDLKDKDYLYPIIKCLILVADERSLEVLEDFRKRKLLPSYMPQNEMILKIVKARGKVDPDHKMSPEQVVAFDLQRAYEIAAEGHDKEGEWAILFVAGSAKGNPMAERLLEKLSYSQNFAVSALASEELSNLRKLRKHTKEKLDELGK